MIIKDYFDSYNDGDLNGQGSWSGATEFDIQATTVHTGTKAVAITSSGVKEIIKDFTYSSADGWIRIYIRVSATGSSGELKFGIREGTTDICGISVYGNSVRFQSNHGNDVIGTVGANTWYSVDIQWRNSDHLVSARFNDGSWTSWYSPWNSWTNVSRILLRSDNIGDGKTLYFDTLSYNVLQGPSYLTGYTTRKKLTIDHTKIATDLTNFPVLVKLTDARFDWTHANADGFDIRFTTDDGTTLCKYERERHDGADYAEYWVKIPSVSSTTDTDFYIYYRTTDTADGADPTNVWDSDFKAVYHLKDDPNTSTCQDSTTNNKDVAKKGANEPIEANGKIVKGQQFDGSNDYGTITGNLLQNASACFVSFWASFGTTPAIQSVVSCYKDDNDRWLVYLSGSDAADERLAMGRSVGGAWGYVAHTGTNLGKNGLSNGALHHIFIYFNGSGTGKIYVDGVDKTSFSGTITGLPNITTNTTLGDYPDATHMYFKGVLDELRISNVSRSIAFGIASYNSEADTLLTYGSEEESINLSISVNDSVTVSENIQSSIISPILFVSVYDSVTASEDVSLFITSYFLSVYDSISVVEALVSVVEALVYDHDLIIVSEYVLIKLGSFEPTDLYDDVTVSENIDLLIPELFINVFDSVSVSENINLYIPILYLSVSDSVTVSEDINLFITEYFCDIFDSVTVSENINAFINQQVPSVFDSVTVSEDVVLYIPTYISVYDDISVSENVDVLIKTDEDFYESISVSENIVLNIPVYISVYDDVSVSDVSTIQSTNGFFTDDITVSEYINLYIPILYLSVYDSVTVSEEESEEGILSISVYDIVVADDINITTYDQADVDYDDIDVCYNGIPLVFIEIVSNPSIYDDVTVSEYVELFIPIMTPSVYDDITVSEYILLSIPLPVDVYDDIPVSENIEISIKTDEDFYELITVSEDILLSIPLPVEVYDLISVSDDILISVLLPPVEVYDSVSVSENVDISVKTDEDFYELITVSEDILLSIPLPPLPVEVYDLISVSEYVLLSVPLPVEVYDSVFVSENVDISVKTDEDFYELITVSEDIQLQVSVSIDVNDSVSVYEDVLLSIPLPVDINDSVTVFENIEISVQTDEDFYELITVSEYIVFDIRLPVDVYDTVLVTENIKPEMVSHIYPIENVFVYEYFSSIKNTFGYDIPSRRPMGDIDILIGMGDAPIYRRLGEIDIISDAGSGTSVEYIGSGEIDNNYIIGGGL